MTGGAMAVPGFRVLGPVEVLADGRPLELEAPKQRSLLALLVIHANQIQSTDRIIDALWGEEPPEGGVKTLRYHVSKLRQALGPHAELIVTRSPGYVLDIPAESIDSQRFEGLLAQAQALLGTEPDRASQLLGEALGLWRGEAFADFPYEEFTQIEARRLEELRLLATEDRGRAELAGGGSQELVGEFEALVAKHPLRERLRAVLMVALYRAGRQAEALHEYDRLRKQLVEQLGLDPSPMLQTLEQRILDQDPALVSGDPFVEIATADRAEVRNPYKGLRAFAETDAGDFHGRGDLIERMAERLSEPGLAGRFLIVAGPSGSGKSSVVRAGLIPALRREAVPGSHLWRIATMYPGTDPVTRLDDILTEVDDTESLLLVIDQFEETFVLADSSTCRTFLERIEELVTRNRPVRVICTIRADFLDRPLTYPSFARLLDAGLMLVTPLLDDEVRAAVVEPAAAVGVRVDPEVAAAVIASVNSRAATLPLLQYALTDLFEHRRDNQLTLDAYRAAGAITGALARRADQIYEELDPTEREAARQLLLRMVTVTPETEHLRRRVPGTELADLPLGEVKLDRVLDRFGQQRLLTFDQDSETGEATVEVAHEALLREWPRLRDWVEANREDLRTHRRLTAAISEWAETDHDSEFLPTGNRLAQFQSFATDSTLVLSAPERAYLDAAEARVTEETRRASRRRRSVVATLGTAALVSVVLAGVALNQRNRAETETRITAARELAGSARSSLAEDPELSILLALEAIETTSSAGEPVVGEATGSLHEAVLASRWSATLPGAAKLAWSPDGTRIVAKKPGALLTTAVVLDVQTGEPIHELGGMVDSSDVAWSPDGEFIATTDDQGPTILWEADTGRRLPALADGMMNQKFPVFSADGTLLAARSISDSSVTVVDTTTGTVVTRIECPVPHEGWGIGLSPAGDLLAVATWDETLDHTRDHIDLYTVPGGEPTGVIGPHPVVFTVQFSPDGTKLATSAQQETLEIWDVATGENLISIPEAGVGQRAWSPDGSMMALGWVHIANIETGEKLVDLLGHDSPPYGKAFSPDGKLLATADLTKTRLWDLSHLGGEIASFSGEWSSAAWSPEGSRIVATDWFDRTHLLDVFTGEKLVTYEQEPRFGGPRAAVSPNGRFAAMYAERGQGAVILDAGTLQALAWPIPRDEPIPGASSEIFEQGYASTILSFSPDSSRLAVNDNRDNRVRLFDTTTWEEVDQLDLGAEMAAYLPDGRHLLLSKGLVMGEGPGEGVLWDLEAHAEVTRIPLPAQGQNGGLAVSRDGLIAAIGENESGQIQLWAIEPLIAGAGGEDALIRSFDTTIGLSGVVLSPNSSTLYAGNGDGTVDVFDVDTGDHLYAIAAGEWLSEISLSPDGRYLALPTTDGLHVITTDLDELVSIARDRLSRSLTDVECQTYLHVEECPDR